MTTGNSSSREGEELSEPRSDWPVTLAFAVVALLLLVGGAVAAIQIGPF